MFLYFLVQCTIGLRWVKTVASNEDVPSSAVPTFDIPCTTPTALAISVVSTNRISLHYCGIVLSIGGVSQHCVTWTQFTMHCLKTVCLGWDQWLTSNPHHSRPVCISPYYSAQGK